MICLFVVYSPASSFENKQQGAQATAIVFAYFDTLISKNILTIPHLECLLEHSEFTNPITETEALSSNLVHIHWTTINKLIAANKNDLIDPTQIHHWAKEKLNALKDAQSIKEQVRKSTTPIYHQMNFIELPASTYTNPFDGSTFEIEEGIEFQDNLVTHYQWALVMNENPSANIDLSDSEDIFIDGKKIKLEANAPVNNISWDRINAYIGKLNNQDTEYSYALPSVYEYFAIMQAALGQGWAAKIPQSVGWKNPLLIKGKRIWSIINSLWQWTRDWVNLTKNDKAHLIFGFFNPYGSKLLMPIIYDTSKDKTVGLRLIRFKKNKRLLKSQLLSKQKLSWSKKTHHESSFIWDHEFEFPILIDDHLKWLYEHSHSYASDIQHTLNCLKAHGSIEIIKSLKQLFFDEEKINNLYPLTSLINLQELSIPYNIISDILPLHLLKNLRYLKLCGNQISDVSALSELTNLEALYLNLNQIIDISALHSLTNLKKLWVGSNELHNLEPINSLLNLETLHLSSNNINNLSTLSSLKHLKYLSLNLNPITDISPISGLKNLIELDLWENQISDISPLNSLTNLERLFLSDNQISTISDLCLLKSLKHLKLDGNRIYDISMLSKLKDLEELNLQRNQINDISALGSLSNLTDLSLDDNQISDISVLSTLTSLKRLTLNNNQVNDLSPLKSLKQLEYLCIRDNPVKILNSLKNLTAIIHS